MKISKLFLTAAAVAALSLPAFAADISGKWKAAASQGGQTGRGEQTFVFQVKDGKITGSTTDPRMGESQITEGTVTEAEISFTVTATSPMGEMKMAYKGTIVNDDQIKLTRSMAGGGRQGGPGGPGGPGGQGGPGAQGGPGGPGGPGGSREIVLERVK
jgi:hypothetical protein